MVVVSEVLEFFDGKIKHSEVEPGVEKHVSMSGGGDEAIVVDPLGVLGVVLHLM